MKNLRLGMAQSLRAELSRLFEAFDQGDKTLKEMCNEVTCQLKNVYRVPRFNVKFEHPESGTDWIMCYHFLAAQIEINMTYFDEPLSDWEKHVAKKAILHEFAHHLQYCKLGTIEFEKMFNYGVAWSKRPGENEAEEWVKKQLAKIEGLEKLRQKKREASRKCRKKKRSK